GVARLPRRAASAGGSPRGLPVGDRRQRTEAVVDVRPLQGRPRLAPAGDGVPGACLCCCAAAWGHGAGWRVAGCVGFGGVDRLGGRGGTTPLGGGRAVAAPTPQAARGSRAALRD